MGSSTVGLKVDSKSRAKIGSMTEITDAPMRIAEVAERTGLSGHTLRFYESEGLLPDPVERDGAGHRVFSEDQVQWLLVCSKMRSSGMSLPDIRRYAELTREGPGTVAERFEVLRSHERKVRDQLADLQEALDIIQGKVALYAREMEGGTADGLWRDGPRCDVSRSR
jgi:DNA-binding transcriptional MerR regulator